MTISIELILALGVVVRLVLIAGTLVALWAGVRFTGQKAQRRVGVALVLLAVVSLGIWMNPGNSRRSARFIQTPQMFHYYLGSKYRHELGYFNLYGAALVADAEDSPRYFKKIKVTRDLRDYQLIRPRVLRGDPQFRERFSPERWKAFRADLAYIQHGIPPAGWEAPLRDHGNNGPPTQAFVTGTLASLLGAADARSLLLLSLLDPLLVAVLLVTTCRVYNLRTAALVAIFFGMNELCEFGYIAGALLRLDWLVAAGLGICCLRSRRHLLAGCFLGTAAMLRIFPVFFALAVVLKGGLEFVRSGSWPPLQRRFVVGLALGTGPLFLASLGPELDPQAWFGFLEKIRLHHEVVATNIIGLRQLFEAGSLWLWLVCGGITLLFLSSLSRVDDAQAAILGGTLVFALLTIADYYYGFLLLFVLWQSWERADARDLVLLGLLFFSASIGVVVLRAMGLPMMEHFRAATLSLLVTFVVLFAQIHAPRKRAMI